jgi:hypothetical protein
MARTKSLKVVGIAQDPTTGADDFLAPPFVYISMDTLLTLRQPNTCQPGLRHRQREQKRRRPHPQNGGRSEKRIEKSG